MYTDLVSFFTGRLINKLVRTWVLSSPQVKCVATIPRDLSLVTTLVCECRLFSDVHVLQGSIAARMRRDGIFNNQFNANFLENLPAKNFLKSVRVWRTYCDEFGVSRFRGTRCSWRCCSARCSAIQRRDRALAVGAVVSAVEWSRFENFAPLVGHQIIHDARCSQYKISGLEPACDYYVRVCAGNIKGFGSPSAALVGIPSSKI